MTITLREAYILLTIHACQKEERGASLGDIIAFYDYINHDILGYEELQHALKTLIPSSTVAWRGQNLATSQEFHTWWNREFGLRKRMNVPKEAKVILDYLTSGEIKATESITMPLSETEFREAINHYLTKTNGHG